MRLPVSSGSKRPCQRCPLQPRAATCAGLPALLFVAGLALVVMAAGLGWALLLFGLGLAQLLWSPKIGAPDRHETSWRLLVFSHLETIDSLAPRRITAHTRPVASGAGVVTSTPFAAVRDKTLATDRQPVTPDPLAQPGGR
jgi:hypothetical protein